MANQGEAPNVAPTIDDIQDQRQEPQVPPAQDTADDKAPTQEEMIAALEGHVAEQEKEANSAPEPAEQEIPEKYRGKSMQEVIKMHQEAEKAMGRQGGELGELRSVVDEYLQGNQTAPKPNVNATSQTPEAAESPDFDWDNPREAVQKIVQNDPEREALRQAAADMRRTQATQTIAAKHPDAGEIVNSREFAKFVLESPMRKEMFARAETSADVAAADELLTQFKVHTQRATQAVEADKAERKAAITKANTGNSPGSAAKQGKRRYRRSALVELKRDNPRAYEANLEEITAAYREKRVY